MNRALFICRGVVVVLLLALCVSAQPGACANVLPAARRRAALIERAKAGSAAIPELRAALNDEVLLVRRTAVRLLTRLGDPAKAAVIEALGNTDVLVRLAALRWVCGAMGADAMSHLAKALDDASPLLRRAAAKRLLAIRPRTAQVSALLAKAREDKDDGVRKVAAKALWTFHRENVSMRNNTKYDHDVTVAQTIPLPKDGWKFKLDPASEGHLKKWFAPKFDHMQWHDIAIEQAWQKAGHAYIGVAWYRRRVDLPGKPECLSVDLHFKGVDECAWVWVNGIYVGQHDMGPEGWDEPFMLDVTKELRWGQENQITVRAMNTTHAGGIWRPVLIEVLK